MSVTEASAAEATFDSRAHPFVLDQEPKQGEEARPSDKHERDNKQQALSTLNRDDHGSRKFAFVGSLAALELAWIGALAYLAHRLLF